jgi:hypothetical protein
VIDPVRAAALAPEDLDAAPPPPRRGFVPLVGRALLVAAVPLSMFWFRVGTLGGAGNVTASDVVLVALWLVTVVELLLRGPPDAPRAPLAIACAAVLVGVLAGLGAALSGGEGGALFELSLLMKRFGLAAILPLAGAALRSPRLTAATRAVALLTLVTLAVFSLVPPLRVYLPRPADFDLEGIGLRGTGLVTNPNDLAYCSIGLALLWVGLLPASPRPRDRVLLAVALAACGVCVVVSASRSGLLGGAAALAYLIVSRELRAPTKLALGICAALVVAWGLSSSESFRERVVRAYVQGRQEVNVSSRLQAQWVAARASLEHPLGVGYTNFAAATRGRESGFTLEGSDSVYFDTLLGAGFAGLALLLLLFHACWRHAGAFEEGGPLRARALRAALLAFFVFGAASVIPIAVSLSPLFFTIAAAAAYPDAAPPDGAEDEGPA